MPNENVIIALFGTKGSGKSELSKKIVEEYSRVIAVDMLGEYDLDQVACSVDDAINVLVEHEQSSAFSLSVRLPETDDYLDVLECAYEMTDTLIVVEEASFLCSASSFPPELSKLVRYGRHRRISQLYISRRPAEVSRDVTAQADVLVTFRQREPRDLDYLYSCAPGARMSRREFGAYVEGLPDYRCAVFGDKEVAPLAVIEASWRKMPEQGELFAVDGGSGARESDGAASSGEATPVTAAKTEDETAIDEDEAQA
jgi:hypothetical protein